VNAILADARGKLTAIPRISAEGLRAFLLARQEDRFDVHSKKYGEILLTAVSPNLLQEWLKNYLCSITRCRETMRSRISLRRSIAAHENNYYSRRQVAELFPVSQATVRNPVRRKRETGKEKTVE
jgi:hypothetical protein